MTVLHAVKETAEISAQNSGMMNTFFRHRLSELLPQEAALWCEPELIIEEGEPAETILRVAAEQHSDLIVLGVRHSASFPGHLPPTTAYKVVCQAQCPVLTVRI